MSFLSSIGLFVSFKRMSEVRLRLFISSFELVEIFILTISFQYKFTRNKDGGLLTLIYFGKVRG